MSDITLYNRASKGGIKVWRSFIDADGTTVVKQWGLEGAKQQETRDPMKPRGKEGTKAYKAPAQVAIEEWQRNVKKKQDEGYTASKADVRDDVKAESQHLDIRTNGTPECKPYLSGLDFDNPPKEFAPAKPINDADHRELAALASAGKLIIQRKRDGMRHFIFFGERTRIFTRRMDDASGQFKELIDKLEPLREVLIGTVLDTEFVVPTFDDKDDFAAVASICRSGELKAQQRLRAMTLSCNGNAGWHFMVFDVLYLQDAPSFHRPYRQRYTLLQMILKKDPSGRLRLVDNLTVAGLAGAMELVKSKGWEGLVAWEADKGSVVQLNGKPKRVNCSKVKPCYEGDFVATGYELGDGRNSDKVGALYISQAHNGEFVEVGKVGTGLSEGLRKEALTWSQPYITKKPGIYRFEVPQVVQCEFAERTPPSKDNPIGALRFPVFVRRRTDKTPEECVYAE